MSDQSQGAGWWQASDDKWYPPQSHPDYVAPAAPPPTPTPPAPTPTPWAAPPQGPPVGPAPSMGPPRTGNPKADAKAAKAYAKATRPWFKKKRIILPGALLILVIAIAATSGGSDDKDTTATSPGTGKTTETTKPPKTSRVGVGGTDTTSGFDVTLVAVEFPFKLAQYDSKPSNGDDVIGVELSMKNTKDEQQPVSTLLGMEIRDDAGRRFNISLHGLDRPQLDGQVEPGQSVRGWATFDVPPTSTGLYLHVAGSLTATGADYDLGVR